MRIPLIDGRYRQRYTVPVSGSSELPGLTHQAFAGGHGIPRPPTT